MSQSIFSAYPLPSISAGNLKRHYFTFSSPQHPSRHAPSLHFIYTVFWSLLYGSTNIISGHSIHIIMSCTLPTKQTWFFDFQYSHFFFQNACRTQKELNSWYLRVTLFQDPITRKILHLHMGVWIPAKRSLLGVLQFPFFIPCNLYVHDSG